MDTLRKEIAVCFNAERPPRADSLVLWDGFDELEKEYAIAFYSGKSWQDVLQHLRGLKDRPVSEGATYYLEEWSVLSQEPLSYYLRAHLEFLLDNLCSDQPDEEFMFSFIGELYQVVFMYKGSPFSLEQTLLLGKVAQVVAKNAANQGRFAYFGGDIESNVEKFFSILQTVPASSPKGKRPA